MYACGCGAGAQLAGLGSSVVGGGPWTFIYRGGGRATFSAGNGQPVERAVRASGRGSIASNSDGTPRLSAGRCYRASGSIAPDGVLELDSMAGGIPTANSKLTSYGPNPVEDELLACTGGAPIVPKRFETFEEKYAELLPKPSDYRTVVFQYQGERVDGGGAYVRARASFYGRNTTIAGSAVEQVIEGLPVGSCVVAVAAPIALAGVGAHVLRVEGLAAQDELITDIRGVPNPAGQTCGALSQASLDTLRDPDAAPPNQEQVRDELERSTTASSPTELIEEAEREQRERRERDAERAGLTVDELAEEEGRYRPFLPFDPGEEVFRDSEGNLRPGSERGQVAPWGGGAPTDAAASSAGFPWWLLLLPAGFLLTRKR